MRKLLPVAFLPLITIVCPLLFPLLSEADKSEWVIAHEQQVIELKEKIRKNPNNAETHFLLGEAYRSLSKSQEAIAEFKEAVRIKPDYAESHVHLGMIYDIPLNKPHEAMAAFKEAIRINPDYFDAHFFLGDIYADLGQHKEAVSEYKEAIRINPDDSRELGHLSFSAQTHHRLGLEYSALGKNHEAIAEHEEAIRMNPDFIEAHLSLSAVYDFLKEGSNAIIHMSIAAKLFTKTGDIAHAADAKKNLRILYKQYGYKPSDFASEK